MICIHHNKDLDGFTSGAIVKRKFPDCKLIGWDYGNPIPEMPDNEDIVLIDISFPMEDMAELRKRSKSLTWIDHHISAFKDWTEVSAKNPYLMGIKYVFELGIAACEIGWKYYFPDEKIPEAVLLLGEYDTWRNQDEYQWENRILPFQYIMRLKCNSAESFPQELFNLKPDFDGSIPEIERDIEIGKLILKYQRGQDERAMKASFVIDFEGLRALVLNVGGASSNTFLSVWDEEKHDIMIPFFYSGNKWTFSIYTTKEDIDCSALAKARGGGGHKKAAGFISKTLPTNFKKEEIFQL